MSRLDLGVGIIALGYVDQLWSDIAPVVDVVEVEPQTLWDHGGPGTQMNQAALGWIGGLGRPIVTHGIGFPVGGQAGPEQWGVELFATCSKLLGASHASEHLAYNATAAGRQAGFLLPPRQTWATIEAACEHIGRYQRCLDVPFLVESAVSYLAPSTDELDDATFLTELVERADCGLLLDLHNLVANERNGRQPVADVVANIPTERVIEIHVAGGFEYEGYWLDAHSGSCDEAVLAALAATVPRCPNLRAVIFEALPPYLVAMGPAGVRAELEAIHRIVDGAGPAETTRRPPRPARHRPATRAEATVERLRQEATIGFTTRRTAEPPEDDAAYPVLRELTDQARLGRLLVADEAITELYRTRGAAETERLALAYLAECDAQLWTRSEAEAFCEWLGRAS